TVEAYIYPPPGTEPAEVTHLTVDAVTNVTFEKGLLQVEKRKITIPTQGAAPEPGEWVSDVRMKDNHLVVEKVKITPGPEGLRAQYSKEVNPQPPECPSPPPHGHPRPAQCPMSAPVCGGSRWP